MLDYQEYFKRQNENAKLRNRIKFIRENKEWLSFKQKTRYLFRYSPALNQMAFGRAMADGFAKGLEDATKELEAGD